MLAQSALFIVVALVSAKADDAQLAKAHNHFAVKLLKHLAAQENSSNVFFSPTSIAAAFGILYAGAKGNTKAELASVLGLTEVGLTEKTRVLEAYKSLLKLTSSQNVTLEVVNMVLTQKSFQMLPSYSQQLRDVFGAELRSTDFANEGRKVAAEVNSWVREKTRGKIDSIVNESDLSNAVLLIVNAIYFKATWLTKFRSTGTQNKPFLNQGTMEVSKPAMHITRIFPYTRVGALKARAVEVPYSGGRFSMVVLLPDSPTGIGALRDGLSFAVLEDVSSKLAKRYIALSLPKFDMSLRYRLVPSMKALGLNAVFGRDANLTGISESNSIRLSNAVHKAAVKVNERGTFATAVTGLEFAFMSAKIPIEPPIEFVVNHPFLFYIRDRSNNRILFFGEVHSL